MLQENLMPIDEISSASSVTDDGGNGGDRDMWHEVFPLEIIFCRALINNAIIVKMSNIFYILIVVVMVVNIAIAAIEKSYLDDHYAISLVVLMHVEGTWVIALPFVSYWFLNIQNTSLGLNELIKNATKIDSHVKLKFRFISFMNLLVLTSAICIYLVETSWEQGSTVIVLGIFFLCPLTIVVSLGECIIELHRIVIQNFRDDINEKRQKADDGSSNKHILSTPETNFEEKKQRDSLVEMNIFASPVKPMENSCQTAECISNEVIKDLNYQYHKIYTLCRDTSLRSGLYILFFLCFGFLYAFTTLYGIYLGEYPSKDIAGFVVVGLFLAIGLGATLTACNETGHLVCRDLSSYLVSLPICKKGGRVIEPNDNAGSESLLGGVADEVVVTNDAIMLLSAMNFMKLQICYFGNMALRSSLSFAVLGTLLAAMIPLLIENEG